MNTNTTSLQRRSEKKATAPFRSPSDSSGGGGMEEAKRGVSRLGSSSTIVRKSLR